MVPNIAHIHQPERRTDGAINRDALTWAAAASPASSVSGAGSGCPWCWCCFLAPSNRDCACWMTGPRKRPSWASRAEAKGLQRSTPIQKAGQTERGNRATVTLQRWSFFFLSFFFKNQFNLLRHWVEQRSEWKRSITAGPVNECLQRQLHYCFREQPDAKRVSRNTWPRS